MADQTNKKRKNKCQGSVCGEGDLWTVFFYVLDDKGVKKRTSKRSIPSEKEAWEFLAQKNKEFEEQKKAFECKKYVEDRSLLLWEFMTNHYESVYSKQVENSTSNTYRFTLYNHLLPILKSDEYRDLKLIDVTRRDLNNIIYKVYTRKKSYGKKAKELFSVFMAVAKQDNLIVNNPAYNLKSPRYEKKKFYPIRIEKLKELLVAASDTPTYLEILLGLMMGLRKGEIYGIKIEDINIKAQLLHVSQQVTYECEYDELTLISREQTEKDLKTENSERTLYIPDLIMAEIHNRLNRIEKDKLQKGKAYEDNHYLCGQRNGKPRAGGCLNIALNKLTAKVGVPKMAFHYLRHMTVTILLYLGFDLKTISKILGHASIKTTLMHYATDWDGEEDINRVFNRLISMTFGDAPYSTGVEMTGGAV